MTLTAEELKLLINGDALSEVAKGIVDWTHKSLWEKNIIPDKYEITEPGIPGSLKVVETEDEMEYEDHTGVEVPITVLKQTVIDSDPKTFKDLVGDGSVYVKFTPSYQNGEKEIYLRAANAQAASRLEIDPDTGEVTLDGKPIGGTFNNLYKGIDESEVAKPAQNDAYFNTKNKTLSMYNALETKWELVFTWVDRSEIFKETTTPEHHEKVDPIPSKPSESVLEVVPNDTDPIDPNTQIKKEDLPPELNDVNEGDKIIKDDPQDGSDPTYKKPTADNYPSGSKEVVPDSQDPYDPDTQIKESEVKPLPGGDPIVPGDHVITVPEETKEEIKFPTKDELEEALGKNFGVMTIPQAQTLIKDVIKDYEDSL